MPLSGEVVFLRIFDLGGTLDLNRARKNLGDMAQLSRVHPTKAAPEYMSFAAPVPIDLSSLNLELTDEDGKPASISARLYEVGALAIMLRLQLRGEKITDLARYHNMQLYSQGRPVKRQQLSGQVLETLRPQLRPALVDVFDVPVESEPYTAYVVTESPDSAEALFREHRAQIAGLLISEPH